MKAVNEFNVLLVYPNLSLMKIPSLAIALFTSILKGQGYNVDMFDASCYTGKDNKHDDRRIASFQYRKLDKKKIDWEVKTGLSDDFIAKVKSFKPDIIIMSVVEDTFQQGIELLDLIKGLNIPNIVGGVFPTMAPEEAIAPSPVKMIGIGEGETTIIEVCENIRNDRSCRDTANVWYKENNSEIIRNPAGPLVDIDRVKPDYTLFKEDRFLRPWGGKIFRTIALENVRGCPYDCTFCNSPEHNRRARRAGYRTFVREKNLNAVRAELQYVKDTVDPEFIMFVDDTFLTRPHRKFMDWCDMYRSFKIPFWINTRVEAITKEKLVILKEIGCYRLSFSLEQGNEDYRRKYLKKQFSNKVFIEKARLAASGGIPFSIDVLIGLPYETRELVFDTIDVIRRVPDYDALTVNIFTPYRGAELRQLVIDRGWLDPKIFPDGISGKSLLRMPEPYLQRDEIDGLFRTFALYAHFNKDRWPEIKKAETDSEEGINIFNRLGKEYYLEKFGDAETEFYAESSGRVKACNAPPGSRV